MKRPWILGLSLITAGTLGIAARGQQPNFAMLAGQGFAQGLADVVRSASQQNMRPSQAAIDHQTAQSMSYDNQIKRVVTFHEKRKLGQMYRAAERGPAPTSEQLARMSKASKPDRLNSQQFDSIRGRINWPVVLKAEQFTEQRDELNQRFASHVAAGGGINTADYAEIQRVAAEMETELKKLVDKTNAEQFMYARKFLASLRYEARFEAGT